MKLIILFLAMLIANPALAVTCLNDYDNSCAQEPGHSTEGDCEDLGYSTTIEKDCEHTIVCPFNSSYKRCVKLKKPTCEEMGYNLTSQLSSNICKSHLSCKDESTNMTYYRCNGFESCTDLGYTSTTKIDDCTDLKTCIEGDKTYYLCGDFPQKLPTCIEKGYRSNAMIYPPRLSCKGSTYSTCTDESTNMTFYRCNEKSCATLGYTSTTEIDGCTDLRNCIEGDKTYYLCANFPQTTCKERGYNLTEPPSDGVCTSYTDCADESTENKIYYRCNGVKTCSDLKFKKGESIEGCKTVEHCVELNSNLEKVTYSLCSEVEEIDCTELGYTTDDKTKWCDANQIKKCPTNASYTLCAKPDSTKLGFTEKYKYPLCNKYIVEWPYNTNSTSNTRSVVCQSMDDNIVVSLCEKYGFVPKGDISYERCAEYVSCPFQAGLPKSSQIDYALCKKATVLEKTPDYKDTFWSDHATTKLENLL